MKCSNCGSNLEIETPFCPYCGVENQFAKKHREEMKRYDKDYNRTKREVIDNAARFNRKTFRITMIAVTVLMFFAVITIAALSDSLGSSHRRAKGEENAKKYEADIRRMVADRDYLALNEFMEAYSIRPSYKLDEYDIYPIKSAVNHFANIHHYVLEGIQPGGTSIYNQPSYISDSIKSINRLVKQGSRDSEVADFLSDIQKDTFLYLEIYLKMSKEDAELLSQSTDAQINLLIEEAWKNVTEE